MELRLPPGTSPEDLRQLLTPRWNQFIGINPNDRARLNRKQLLFLSPMANSYREGFYGGSAGGGKSVALLASALQYVDVPTYSCLLLRRTFADLALPHALMDLAQTWLAPTPARWLQQEKTWTFPSGATLTFGYLETEKDKQRYRSAEFQFIGFDELTQFSETQYRFLFSRLRKTTENPVPLRMRSASNPGDVGHDWVKERFIGERDTMTGKVVPPAAPQRFFIPASLTDNAYLDRESYVASLMELDETTREQLLAGDWDARPPGRMFRREWFPVHEVAPTRFSRLARVWDFAATPEVQTGKADPDWTVGLLMGRTLDGAEWWVLDVVRLRGTPGQVQAEFERCIREDVPGTVVRWEQEGGSAGKFVTADLVKLAAPYDVDARQIRESDMPLSRSHMQVQKLAGKSVGSTPYEAARRRDISGGGHNSKVVRARPVSRMAEQRRIMLVKAGWNSAFLGETSQFPDKAVHDDIVDTLAYAYAVLTTRRDIADMAELNRALAGGGPLAGAMAVAAVSQPDDAASSEDVNRNGDLDLLLGRGLGGSGGAGWLTRAGIAPLRGPR